MDNALVMGVLKGLENLHRKVDCLFPAQDVLLLDIFLEGDAIDIFHDDRLDAVGEDDIIHLDDVWVVQQ